MRIREDIAYWRNEYGATQEDIIGITGRTSGSIGVWFDSEAVDRKREIPFPSYAVDILSMFFGDEPLDIWKERISERVQQVKENRRQKRRKN